MFYYDNSGWICDSSKHRTTVAPPDGDWSIRVVGDPLPLFNGVSWMLLPYDGFVAPDEVEPEPTPVPQIPEVVITSITSDDPNMVLGGLSVVDINVGSNLSVVAEIQIDGKVIPLSKVFRMPMKAVGSPYNDRLIRVEFIDGIATFTVALPSSRHWSITEGLINESLSPEEKLKFDGLDVYVLE